MGMDEARKQLGVLLMNFIINNLLAPCIVKCTIYFYTRHR